MTLSVPVLAESQLRPGQVVDGRYRLESFLGGGGMASLYRAVHLVLEQPVALKILSPGVRALPGAAARFLREARAATQLKSPHVVRVMDVGTMADGAPYIVMELLEGQDLDRRLVAGWRPSLEEAIAVVLQACTALAEVHGLGIVHRDLKPANLFLTTGPDGLPLVKIIDFGISRLDAPVRGADAVPITDPEIVMGSPRYMAPEAMESAALADARSDIWALGTVLYELLVGPTPYDGDSLVAIYSAALQGPPSPTSSLRDDVPAGVDAVIARCLRIDPRERFGDVAELAVKLAPFGGASASRWVEEVIRVLAAARRRANHAEATPDTHPVEPERSIANHHISRITGSAAQRRRKVTDDAATDDAGGGTDTTLSFIGGAAGGVLGGAAPAGVGANGGALVIDDPAGSPPK